LCAWLFLTVSSHEQTEEQEMDRRSILSVAGAALGTALPAIAQTQRAMRLGILGTYPLSFYPASSEYVANSKRFFDELRRLGWEEGRNLIVEYRYSMNDPQKHYANAEELVAARVDVITVLNNLQLAAAFKATKTIPIMAMASGLVESGYAKSLAQPGGNVTGVEFLAGDAAGKLFEVLYSIRPGLKKIGLSEGRGTPASQSLATPLQAVADARGVTVVSLPSIAGPTDIDPMLTAAKREGIQALALGPGTFVLEGEGAHRIQTWATENKVLTYSSNWHRGQLLLASGPDFPYFNRVAAGVVDRLLRGTRPADIPIEQALRFVLIINQKIARAMGLKIPTSLLIQATEVIE
jgi:putative ABC transport system substrate-binding protein